MAVIRCQALTKARTLGMPERAFCALSIAKGFAFQKMQADIRLGGNHPVAIGNHKPTISAMSLGMILLIVLILALLGVLPTWGHSKAWGYGPSGILGTLLIIVIILLLLGKL